MIPGDWKPYQKQARLVFAGLLLGLPAITFLSFLFFKFAEPGGELLFAFAIFLWALWWGYQAIKLVRMPCPRCGEMWLAWQDPFFIQKRQCAKCGLLKYEEP